MRKIQVHCKDCNGIMETDENSRILFCRYCGSKALEERIYEVSDEEVKNNVYRNEEIENQQIELEREKLRYEQEKLRYEQETKRKNLKWWILGWLLFFPIPLTILIIKNKTLSVKNKAIIISIIWGIVLVYGSVRKSERSKDVSVNSEVESQSKSSNLIDSENTDDEDTNKETQSEVFETSNSASNDNNLENEIINQASDIPVSEETNEPLEEKQKYQLYIDVKSEYNIMFSKYAMELYIDEQSIGTVNNGESFSKLMDVEEGNHTITAINTENNYIKAANTINVANDMTFKSNIAHGETIEFKNSETISDIHGSEIPMIDVSGLVLNDAINKLKSTGFTTIREEPYSEIWNKNNWKVISQSIPAGTATDKNTQIILNCEKIQSSQTNIVNSVETQNATKPNIQDKATIKVTGKTNIQKDIWNGIYSDYVKLTIQVTNNTPSSMRGIQGVLYVDDMFGKNIIKANCDFTGQTVWSQQTCTYTDKSYEINQFIDKDVKFYNTNFQDLVFRYEITQIVYGDGTSESK